MHSPSDKSSGSEDSQLPVWSLDILYTSPDDPDIASDMRLLEKASSSFVASYHGKLKYLLQDKTSQKKEYSSDAKKLAEAVISYQRMVSKMRRLSSYASLLRAEDLANEQANLLYGKTEEFLSEIDSKLLFFAIEVGAAHSSVLDELCNANPSLAKFRPWFHLLALEHKHRLDEKSEQFSNEMSASSVNAWVRLYDEEVSTARFTAPEILSANTGQAKGDGKADSPVEREKSGEREKPAEKLALEQVLNLFHSPDAETRKQAAASLGDGLKELSGLALHIHNACAKHKAVQDKWRRFEAPAQAMHLHNQVEAEIVDTLVDVVVKSYSETSHRYYTLKAKLLEQERLNQWDRMAPVFDQAEQEIPWNDAREIVLSSFEEFSPAIADIARGFFTNQYIHARNVPNKAPGAFSHPTSTEAHPYILINYQGKARDVMTLAHELGHGVHQVLAKEQGELMASTPLTLAETASVFGENLVFEKLIEQTNDKKTQASLIINKIEDSLATINRQISFHKFESALHEMRRERPLSANDLNEIWIDVSLKSLGPSFNFDENFKYYWVYIGHFIHAPFYVYSYAFGCNLVNALIQRYREQPDNFEQQYIELLRAGGSKHHSELLAPFEIDLAKAEVWRNGVITLVNYIDRAEALVTELGLV